MPAKSQEQALTVFRPLKTGDIFLQAVRSDKICMLSDFEPLKEALRYIMLLVGLRANNIPNEEEKLVLINYIGKHYGGHSPEEIRLAFEMAINGELEINPSDVKCYENFSVLYFSSIMNAYRKWSAQQYNQSIKEPAPQQRIYTDEKNDNMYREDVEMYYQRCRNGQVLYNIPDYFKYILVKDGLMQPEETLSLFFVKKLGNNATNIYIKTNDPK